MDKDEIKKLAEDPKNIPGIYNYCDRWCERCAFTSRCLNFKMSTEKFSNEETDINNAAFWKKLGEALQSTLDMLKEMAEERGIDLDSIRTDGDEQNRKALKEKAVVHMIVHISKSYITMVDDWFSHDIYFVENAGNKCIADSSSHSIPSLSKEQMVTVKDAVEVIRWYQHQIYVKLRRAIHSARNENLDIFDDDQKDSDGSAKVALIGIDRSISAWGKILDYFSDYRESTLKIIAYLEHLGKIIGNEFPEARAFVRPGFDEISVENRLKP